MQSSSFGVSEAATAHPVGAREAVARGDSMLYKLVPPPSSSYAIERTGILRRILQATGTKVVLVRAPAGYGKTTTLLQVHDRFVAQGVDCAWLRFDDADNDVSRFALSLGRALAGAGGPTRKRSGPAHGKDETAEDLLDAVSTRRLPFALFVDDMETVSSPAVLGLFAGLVVRLPPGAMLAIGSRNIPDIGLARLRANGQLLEVGPQLLRLSAAETAEFIVARRGLALTSDQVEHLHRRTEGWITALWLASIALEQGSDAARFIAGFGGASTNLADYFANVVLAAQPEAVRGFLVETSILDELTPAACDAVRDRSDSAQLLAQVAGANLFIAASDENRSAYRCHSLFAGFLRAHLQATGGDRLPALHRAASDWFLGQGRPLPAITHALRAAPDAYALGLLEQHADRLLRQGRVRLLARWLDALPADSLADRPSLRVVHAWSVAFTRGGHAALALADRDAAESASRRGEGSDFSTLRALLWFMTDRIGEAHAQALANQPRLTSNTGFAAAMTAQTLANTYLALGHFDDARRFADLARQSQGDGPSAFHLALAGSVEGAVDLVQGRLKSAVARLVMAVEESRRPGTSGAKPFGFPFPSALLAEALYETGDLARAERLLRDVAPLLLDIALPDQLITVHVLLARVQRSRGDTEGALLDLETLENAGHRLGLPRAVACARLERAWALTDQRDFVEAERQIDRSGSSEFWADVAQRCHLANDASTPEIARARLLVRRGAANRAVTELKAMLTQAEGAMRLRRALKLRILFAEALHRDAQPRAAMRQLGLAVEFAAREGWLQTFVEEQTGLRPLLAAYVESAAPATAAGEESTIEMLRRAMRPRHGLPPAEVAGELTLKERRVLQLLASGCSNEAIAACLFVSTSTVRTHLRSINVKLQTNSRTQAVAIGRRLGLVD